MSVSVVPVKSKMWYLHSLAKQPHFVYPTLYTNWKSLCTIFYCKLAYPPIGGRFVVFYLYPHLYPLLKIVLEVYISLCWLISWQFFHNKSSRDYWWILIITPSTSLNHVPSVRPTIACSFIFPSILVTLPVWKS